MTKREVLIELSTKQDRLLKEIEAVAKTMTLSASHQAGNAIAVGMIVSSNLRRLSDRPEMIKEFSYVEPV